MAHTQVRKSIENPLKKESSLKLKSFANAGLFVGKYWNLAAC